MRFLRGVVFSVLLLSGSVFAQVNIDVCNLPNYGCINGSTNGTLMISNLQNNGTLYTQPGAVMPFWIGKQDYTTGLIDTSFLTNVNFGTPIGPGKLRGTMSFGSFKGYVFVTDWVFDTPGYYKIPAMVSGAMTDTLFLTVLPDSDLCSNSSGKDCQNGKGDSIYIYRHSSIVSVDAVYPITVGLIEKSTGLIDSSFNGYSTVDLINGPGTFTGSKLIYGKKWIQFVDLKFGASGVYNIGVNLNDTVKHTSYRDSMQVVVPTSNNVFNVSVSEFKVYPNPSNSTVTVVQEGASQMNLYDQSGRLVKAVQLSGDKLNSISIDDLVEGMYYLKFLDDKNSYIGRSTMVKVK